MHSSLKHPADRPITSFGLDQNPFRSLSLLVAVQGLEPGLVLDLDDGQCDLWRVNKKHLKQWRLNEFFLLPSRVDVKSLFWQFKLNFVWLKHLTRSVDLQGLKVVQMEWIPFNFFYFHRISITKPSVVPFPTSIYYIAVFLYIFFS